MRPNNKKHVSRGFWGDLFERLPIVGAFLIMSMLAGTMFFNADGLPLYFQVREKSAKFGSNRFNNWNTSIPRCKKILRVFNKILSA